MYRDRIRRSGRARGVWWYTNASCQTAAGRFGWSRLPYPPIVPSPGWGHERRHDIVLDLFVQAHAGRLAYANPEDGRLGETIESCRDEGDSTQSMGIRRELQEDGSQSDGLATRDSAIGSTLTARLAGWIGAKGWLQRVVPHLTFRLVPHQELDQQQDWIQPEVQHMRACAGEDSASHFARVTASSLTRRTSWRIAPCYLPWFEASRSAGDRVSTRAERRAAGEAHRHYCSGSSPTDAVGRESGLHSREAES